MIEELKEAYTEVDLSRYGKRNRDYKKVSNQIETMKQERKVFEDIISKQASETRELKEKYIVAVEGIEGMMSEIEKLRDEIKELKTQKR